MEQGFPDVYHQNLTPDRQQPKTFILSTNVDQKMLESEFSFAICRLTGDKWRPPGDKWQ